MPERIQAESGLAGGERILLTRMAKIEARLEGIPEVRSVIVERRLPTTVVIHAVGREPLAVLDIDPAMAVDAQGLMFVARTARPLAALAGWEGQVAPGRSVDPRTRQVLAAYAGFPLGLRDAVVRIDVGAELVLHVGDGTRIEFGPPRDLERKGAAAASVLAAARGRGELLEYVDVRAATAPVSRERGLPTPSPAPAAGD
jgi:cell division septal protein FtsQ